jgi:hypothetical protein
MRIDMTKPKPKHQLQKRGRKSAFRPEYILIAKACARFGAIEDEIANELNIGPATLDRWKQKYPEFRCALKAGKEASDDRVERSLYQLAIGWNGQPPNTTAAIFWLKNRRPDRWRDPNGSCLAFIIVVRMSRTHKTNLNAANPLRCLRNTIQLRVDRA